MSIEEKKRGSFGERYAARWLFWHGFRIIERNFTCRGGEIDLIARKGREIIFVEVKLRKSDRFGEAREFVDARKQQRLRRAAEYYLACRPTVLQPRFDVVELYAPDGEWGKIKLEHIKNAFE